MIRLEYNSKAESFHFSDIGEKRFTHTGWMAIMEKIPEGIAIEFVEYADKELLSTNVYYTWRMMQKELFRWIENQ